MVPVAGNVIGPHLIHKRKRDGRSKGRIVPLGHRDAESNDGHGNALSLNLDRRHLFLSLIVEKDWKIRKVDVRSAYLQVKGISKDLHIYASLERRRTMMVMEHMALRNLAVLGP